MANLARTYLVEKIGPLVGPAAKDGVIEYLLSCDPNTQQQEMVSFLEQYGGKNEKKIPAIIKQYALIEKNLNSGVNSFQHDQGATGKQLKKKNLNNAGGNSPDETIVLVSTDCACMATKHAVWGSCSSCGRIYCVQEQVRECKYCGEIVLPCMSAEDAATAGLPASTVLAYTHKDKLLLFDSENAKRTKVNDAQIDYYHTSSSWMSEEEKKENEKKEKERYDKKFNKSSTFSISIDISGRRIIEDSNSAHTDSKKAQLDDSTSIENLSLAADSSGRAGEVYRDLKTRITSKKVDSVSSTSASSSSLRAREEPSGDPMKSCRHQRQEHKPLYGQDGDETVTLSCA